MIPTIEVIIRFPNVIGNLGIIPIIFAFPPTPLTSRILSYVNQVILFVKLILLATSKGIIVP